MQNAGFLFTHSLLSVLLCIWKATWPPLHATACCRTPEIRTCSMGLSTYSAVSASYHHQFSVSTSWMYDPSRNAQAPQKVLSAVPHFWYISAGKA